MDSIKRRHAVGALGAGFLLSAGLPPALGQAAKMQSWPLGTARRTGIHDLAPAPDGGIWITAQASGHLAGSIRGPAAPN